MLIANWKMQLGLIESKNLALEFKKKFTNYRGKKIVICPDFSSLESVGNIIKSSLIKLGAQNVFWEESGAYTGEVSLKTLEELNCHYVIIGHSERRQILGETNEIINKKLKLILTKNQINPIVCIGEDLNCRQKNKWQDFLDNQIKIILKNINLKNKQKIIIAYEPVWAIGTGKVINPKEAQETHQFIYAKIEEILGKDLASKNFKIIYGGSVKKENVGNFKGLKKIDGFLVGGASLNAEEFYQIAKIIN